MFKRIGVLSGGERNRYALARMLLAPSNFLLLDEPTNHLDMRAKDVLLEALSKYTGTVVFVSHDRYFIDNLATRIFEIEDGHVHVYPGQLRGLSVAQAGRPGASPIVAEAVARTASRSASLPAEPKKRVNPMKVKKLQDRLKEVEQQVAALESEIAQHEAALADFKSVEETMRLTELVTARRTELETRVAEWEELSAALESGV